MGGYGARRRWSEREDGVKKAAERIAPVIPAPVRSVCERLAAGGHAAYTVGGAVRDALLGRDIADWDVATSARPEEVLELFDHTIPTGLQHGTVTVMVGPRQERVAVEVTTFRGEGAYSDSRHPDSVTFGVPLEEDLARRDFVINAIAYDPLAAQIHDPFDGVGDIELRRIRAVGVPAERFAEDGLRVMRAVRFAATLEFDLDQATESAIAGALPALARVSRERVRDELGKLLAARVPSRGLAIAARSGILAQILPEVIVAEEVIGRVDAAPPAQRLAALLADASAETADTIGRRLRLSNSERMAMVEVVGNFPPPPQPVDDVEVRRLLARVGRERAGGVVALWMAAGLAPALGSRLVAAAASDVPVRVADLRVGGGDVVRILGIPPGPIVGEILAELLARALVDPAINDLDRLTELVAEVYEGIASRS